MQCKLFAMAALQQHKLTHDKNQTKNKKYTNKHIRNVSEKSKKKTKMP